jgi:hypothetical protein
VKTTDDGIEDATVLLSVVLLSDAFRSPCRARVLTRRY